MQVKIQIVYKSNCLKNVVYHSFVQFGLWLRPVALLFGSIFTEETCQNQNIVFRK